ncbi:hypothetical protein [Candidatus Pelagibacter sp. HIMB1509]|uniref:hypothetical protein n=1 Tax=Candidatus Pelagibacter sp. HIMB1509 TaxID=3413339 RepID=UPI003F84AA6B
MQKEKFKELGFKVNLSIGYSEDTGFKKIKNQTLKNIKHIYGILKNGGYFLGTFTRFDSHIQKILKELIKIE